MNTIEENVRPIEGVKTSLPQLSIAQKATINGAVELLGKVNQRAHQATAQSIVAAANGIADAYANGKATILEFVAASVLIGTDDSKATILANQASVALQRKTRSILAECKPIMIEVVKHRTEELRLKTAAIETREQEDADIAGILYEPSETAKRMKATFLNSLNRYRELENTEALPSKAELKELIS